MALATRFRSSLTVLTAVDPLLAEAARARFGLDLAQDETEPALREFVGGVIPGQASWAPDTSFDVRVGNPFEVILDAAGRHGSDLIVMGTQGLDGFQKVLLGSTAERVLRKTRIPVLAVPPLTANVAIVDAGGARLELRRILVATDFSDTAAAAVEWAASLAKQLAVPLTLAHVVEPVAVAPQWRSYVSDSDEARASDARTRLEDLSQRLAGEHPRDTVVSLGRPADEIATMAEDREAGMIVVGLTGDQGPLAPRPGSIAYRILSLARTAVLVVPPKTG